MGLLDALNSRDGMFALGLLQAASPKPVRTGLGAGLLQAMQGARSWEQEQEDRQQRAAMQALQMQHLQAQIGETQAQAQQRQAAAEQAKAQAQRQRELDNLPMQFMRTGTRPDSMDNRDVGQPGEQPVPGQQFDLPGYANAMFRYSPQTAISLLSSLRKDTTPIKLGAGEALIDPTTLKPVASNPKEETAPNDWRLYQLSGAPARGIPFDAWDQQRRRSAAPSVSVNTGQHGFDNTLKLRGDFRAEPVYKAHQEMQSAYAQIQQALKQASPAGDMAGATKIMKLLDPSSVVRESELGMALSATGLLDRVQNYASLVVSGQKLTPSQRLDFQALASALYGESVRLYNAKHSEYQGIAERNGLNTADVLGPASAAPSTDGWGIRPKGGK